MDLPLFRIVAPVFPGVNVYSYVAKRTTALGPVMVATCAAMSPRWRVEVIDENNFRGPKGKDGLPDHAVLQRDNPASVVGFHCSLTSTMSRVWELADLYKSQGTSTIAGGWHAHYCPEETLRHNIDLVVHGDGEPVILEILRNYAGARPLFSQVRGCSFLIDNQVKHNSQEEFCLLQIPDMSDALVTLRNQVLDLDALPLPDFSHVLYSRVRVYPVCRIRGCSMNCEFCSVRGEACCASPMHLMRTVDRLVQTRNAKKFFLVDDRAEEDLEGTIEFFYILAKKKGKKRIFAVQMRLEAADNMRLRDAMRRAGVRMVCIGYESPVASELRSMQKGLLPNSMAELSRAWNKYFRVHGMFMVGYPLKNSQPSARPKETVRAYKQFIRRAGLRAGTIQILVAGPVPGSKLRERLERENRLLPLDYRYCDGSFVLFKPIGLTVRELQGIPIKIMKWFYSPMHFWWMVLRIIVFPVDVPIRGWEKWKTGWWRKVIHWIGSRLVKKWLATRECEVFLKKVRECEKTEQSTH